MTFRLRLTLRLRPVSKLTFRLRLTLRLRPVSKLTFRLLWSSVGVSEPVPPHR